MKSVEVCGLRTAIDYDEGGNEECYAAEYEVKNGDKTVFIFSSTEPSGMAEYFISRKSLMAEIYDGIPVKISDIIGSWEICEDCQDIGNIVPEEYAEICRRLSRYVKVNLAKVCPE